MKWTLFFLLFFSKTLVAQSSLDSGLVAYYPFNGNAYDESPNGNDPSTVKVTYAADRFGKPGAACQFNGKSNYIRVPDHPSLHFTKGFSISAWVMVNGFYEGPCHGNRIMMKGYEDVENGNYLLTFDDSYATKGANCSTPRPDKNRQSFYGSGAGPVTNDYIVTGKWYFLTYTHDGDTAVLYVDRKLQAKGALPGYKFSNEEDLFFGMMDNRKFPYWFNGALDEVRIYNRVLRQEEIDLLFSK